MENLTSSNRLLSLDVFRGVIMVLLMMESTGLYDHLIELTNGNILNGFFIQFTHHPWNGLRFWDLIQPGFMFIAGTSMAFSLHKQKQSGMSWSQSFMKVMKRSGWLFFWGVLDYAVRPGGLSFELWDVLTQLSFTTLVAFLIFEWKLEWQLALSLGLLLLTEILYRFTNVAGFNQPFTDQQNLGNYIDLILMNKINKGGWVAINCIPTAAHTIWGAVAGKILLSDKSSNVKVKWLAVAGVVCLIVGFTMDFTITPIIKRISTSSFVFASGGWCLLGLALFYWWIDIRKHINHWDIFTIVGMNSIFIYLFFEIVGSRWFNGYVSAISGGVFELIGLPPGLILILSSLSIFALEWYLCFFLYKRKIFFKL
jgi:predicted acyltransferase